VVPGVGEGVKVGGDVGVTAVGVSTVGVTAVGVSTVGVTAVGVSTVGVTAVGVSTVGVTAVGVSTVGVTAVGVSTVGVAAVGVPGVGEFTGVNVGGRCSRLTAVSVTAISPCAGTTGGRNQFSTSSERGTTIIKTLTAIAISSQIVHGAGARPRPGGNLAACDGFGGIQPPCLN